MGAFEEKRPTSQSLLDLAAQLRDRRVLARTWAERAGVPFGPLEQLLRHGGRLTDHDERLRLYHAGRVLLDESHTPGARCPGCGRPLEACNAELPGSNWLTATCERRRGERR